MNPTLNHKTLSFYLTSLCFLPLAIAFFALPSFLRIEPVNQESFTISMQQFIAQNIQHATTSTLTQPPKEIPKPLPKERKKHKHKRNPAREPISPMQTQAQTSQTSKFRATTSADSTNANSATTGQTIQTLSYGKDNHPFLKAVKSAINNHTKYPRQARKMRIQGKVVVGFMDKTKRVKGFKDSKEFRT